MLPVPEFDQLHIVSDLHMGGMAGFQIFRQGAKLAALIDNLRQRDPASKIALLINGDMVDFLAEPGASYFDPRGAIPKLDRIASDAAFAPVFAALGRFAATVNRQLIITLGNHDLELALPWVRAHLLEKLSGGDDSARGRITLSFDGAGYACSVGGSGVLCLHGNEVDTWNVTDFEALRRMGRDLLQARTVPDWTPNAGTKMVIDVMNAIKKRYAFVDLLKPEVEAVIPILLALDEKQAPKLSKVIAVISHLTWDSLRRRTGFLSAGEESEVPSLALDEKADPTGALDRLMRQTFQPPRTNQDSLLDYIEGEFDKGSDPLQMLEPERRDQQLGAVQAIADWFRGKPKHQVVLEALEKLEKDRSFDRTASDPTFERLNEWVGPGFNFIVAGHTHLEREIPSAGRTYFNSGTWASLIQLTAGMRSSPEKFKPVFDTLDKAQTIDQLVELLPGLVIEKPGVVSIQRDGGAARGSLHHAE
ncbi:MAG: phosphoesterase [Acidimicrobiia bacterium]|nr:phosphoesterase [Acidimicrobiia bacterium]